MKGCCSRGIKAVAVNNTKDARILFDEVVNGNFQIVYISPEMLIGTHKWRSILLDDKYQSNLKGVIIDEAHCVIKW